MGINCKIEHRVRMRLGDGLLLCGVFINLSLMIILGYDMWNPILFYRDKRIILSVLLILSVVRILLYFLDITIWRMCGIEILEIDSTGIRYIKKGRLIKQTTYIPIENVLSINTCEYKKSRNNIDDDQGNIIISYKSFIFGIEFAKYLNLVSQFSNEDIDNILSVYSSIKKGS